MKTTKPIKMKALKQAIDTAFFAGYSLLLLTGGWVAHEKLSPLIRAVQTVQDVQSKLPGLSK